MTVDFQTFPHPGIKSLIPYKPGKSIEELQSETGCTNILKLASNENPLGCSPLALEAIRNCSPVPVANYPSPLNHPLMGKLAQKLNISTEQLFLSNGSDYIYGLLTQCFALHLNKHLLTHDYAFSTYEIQAHALQVPVRKVSINESLEVDVEKIINACTKDTALICIANPNNPTGLLISSQKIKAILDNIPSSTILALDEAYYEYAENELVDTFSFLKLYPNLIITRTFSKIYGLAGLRLGYAIGDPDIIAVLKRVQLPFFINQIALNAAYAALDDHEFIAKSLKVNQAGKKEFIAFFDSLNINYLPAYGNFLTFNNEEDGMKLYNYLLQSGVIIRPLHPYKLPNYLRVTIGTHEQNLRFFNEFKKYKEQK